MRKNAPRKLLHAILDLLPVILIPVFMIYSHRHTIEGNQVIVQENFKSDFNQLNDNLDWYSEQGSEFTRNGKEFTISIDGQNSGIKKNFNVLNHVYLGKCVITSNSSNLQVTFDIRGGDSITTFGTSQTYIEGIVNPTLPNEYGYIRIRASGNGTYIVANIQLFDLTQMFGSGNEPTLQQFNNWFPNSYYDFTLSQDIWIDDYRTVTYDDSDIMSQFSYQLYNVTDKYFNMDKAFNLGEVHQWFNNNIFKGQPPLYINVIWHIVAYELLMDLMMLLYALFMWFIDWCKSLIEKTYDTASGRR